MSMNGLYQVSNLGRVKSLSKPMTNGKGNYYRKDIKTYNTS